MALQPTHSPATFLSGVKTVADTGTAEPISTSGAVVHTLDIQAHSSNTTPVTIGDASVVHGTTTQRGVKLNAGQVWTFYDVKLSEIYVDVGTNGEGVGWVANHR